MTKLFLFSLLFLFPYVLTAQCDYKAFLEEAAAELKKEKKNYQLVLNKYAVARDCPNANNKEIDAKIADLFKDINAQKEKAVQAEAAARTANKQAKTAEDAKVTADEARRVADEARRAADNLAQAQVEITKLAQAARDSATKKAEEQRRANLGGTVQLFVATSKKAKDFDKKSAFFGSAFTLDRDSLKENPEKNPGLVEAAAELSILLNNETNKGFLTNIDSYYYCTNINQVIMGKSFEKIYVVGGHYKFLDITLKGFADAVEAPNDLQITERFPTQEVLSKPNNAALASGNLHTVALNLDQTRIAVAGESSWMQLFDDKGFSSELSIKNAATTGFVYAVRFLNDDILLSISEDKNLNLHDLKAKKTESFPLQGVPMQLEAYQFANNAPNGLILISTNQGIVVTHRKQILEDKKLPAPQIQFRNPQNPSIRHFIFLNDSSYLVVQDERLMDVYKLENYRATLLRKGIDLNGQVVDMCYESNYVMLGYGDGHIQFWENKDSALLKLEKVPIEINQPEPLSGISYYPAQQQLITYGKGYIRFIALNPNAIYQELKTRKKNLHLDSEIYHKYVPIKTN